MGYYYGAEGTFFSGSALTKSFNDVSSLDLNIFPEFYGAGGSEQHLLELNYMTSVDTQIYIAFFDDINGGGNRLTNIDTQYMSFYNNDVGAYNNNVNYVRTQYYQTGNGVNEGGHLKLWIRNANKRYTFRDSTTDKRELSRAIQGSFIHGHNYISDYQMTDVGSFNHESSANPYSSSYFSEGVKCIRIYPGSGTISGEADLHVE